MATKHGTAPAVPKACACLVDARGRLLVFRHPGDGNMQLPKGTIESGESPEQAVRRELLEESGIDFKLIKGDWVATHIYGWTEFELDATSQALTVTTYGIPAYVAGQMQRDAETILALTPQVVSQFVVQPSQSSR